VALVLVLVLGIGTACSPDASDPSKRIRLTFTGRTVRLEAVGVTAEVRTSSSTRAA
jgi:hypothetical protein